MYKHAKNCSIARVSPRLIFGVSWFTFLGKNFFLKNQLYRKNTIFLCIFWNILSSTFRLINEIKFSEKEIPWSLMIQEVSYYSEISSRKKIFLFFQHIWRKKNCFRCSTWCVNEFMLASSVEIQCVNFVTFIDPLEALKSFVIFIIESIQLH